MKRKLISKQIFELNRKNENFILKTFDTNIRTNDNYVNERYFGK